MRPTDKRDAKRSGGMDPGNRLATYDSFGQTLIVTITVNTLSGPDAVELVQEVSQKLKSLAVADDPAAGPKPDELLIRHIVLDLQNVQYMDSGCIGVLVELMTRLQQAGGRIALVNADPNVEYLFKLTRLDRLFPICRDVMRAIESVERAA